MYRWVASVLAFILDLRVLYHSKLMLKHSIYLKCQKNSEGIVVSYNRLRQQSFCVFSMFNVRVLQSLFWLIYNYGVF